MKALVLPQYGFRHLTLMDVPEPVPTDDQVLVKVYAVSINDWDWALMEGDVINRLMNGWSKPRRKIFGSDIAGRVVSVGKNVKRFEVGDEVFGDLSGAWGGFAEYVCADEKSLGMKSPKMTFEEAASIPQAAMLAVQGLIDHANIKAGETVLINGAGGGVGTFGIQLLKPFNVEITAVDSASKLTMLRELGATHTIDYRMTDFTKAGQTYDVILDVKTNRSAFSYLRVLKPGGRYLTVGGSVGKLFETFILSPIISMTTGKRLKVVALKANKDLAYMNKLFEAGQLKCVIDGRFSLRDGRKAFELFEKADHKGKLVITIADS